MKIRSLVVVAAAVCSLFLTPGQPATADPPEAEEGETVATSAEETALASTEEEAPKTKEQKDAEVPAHKLPKAERDAIEAANAAALQLAPAVSQMSTYADGLVVEAARIEAARTAGAEVLP